MIDYVKILKSGSPMVCTPPQATHILVDGELKPKSEASLYLTDTTKETAELIEQLFQSDMEYIIGD